jgi:hypothetical protein
MCWVLLCDHCKCEAKNILVAPTTLRAVSAGAGDARCRCEALSAGVDTDELSRYPGADLLVNGVDTDELSRYPGADLLVNRRGRC